MNSLVSGVISIDVPAHFQSDIANILGVAKVKSLAAVIVTHRSWAFADNF